MKFLIGTFQCIAGGVTAKTGIDITEFSNGAVLQPDVVDVLSGVALACVGTTIILLGLHQILNSMPRQNSVPDLNALREKVKTEKL